MSYFEYPATVPYLSTEKQLKEINSYLTRLVDTLNHNVDAESPASYLEAVMNYAASNDLSGETLLSSATQTGYAAAAKTMQQLRDLIIATSTKVVENETEPIVQRFTGEYSAMSDAFGEYKSEIETYITQSINGLGIETIKSEIETLGGSVSNLAAIQRTYAGYINIGWVDNEKSTWGIDVGMLNDEYIVTDKDGKSSTEGTNENFFTRMTPTALQFIHRSNGQDDVMGYMDGKNIYFPNAVLSSSKIQNGWNPTTKKYTFNLDGNGNLTIGNDFSVTSGGSLTAKKGQIGGWTVTSTALYNEHKNSNGDIYTAVLSNYWNDYENSRVFFIANGDYSSTINNTDTTVFRINRNGTIELKDTGSITKQTHSTIKLPLISKDIDIDIQNEFAKGSNLIWSRYVIEGSSVTTARITTLGAAELQSLRILQSGEETASISTEGNITLNGSITLNNGQRLYGRDSDGTGRTLLYYNSSNNILVATGTAKDIGLGSQTYTSGDINIACAGNVLLNPKTKAYYGSASTNNEIAKIGNLSTYLPLSGGNLTGHLLFNNNLRVRMKDTSGTTKNLIGLNENNNFIIGSNADTEGIAGNISLYNKKGSFHLASTGKVYYGSIAADNEVVKVGDLSSYLKLSGGTMTGSITLSNAKPIQAKVSGGTVYSLIGITSNNTLQIGGSAYPNRFEINAGGNKIIIASNHIYLGEATNTGNIYLRTAGKVYINQGSGNKEVATK